MKKSNLLRAGAVLVSLSFVGVACGGSDDAASDTTVAAGDDTEMVTEAGTIVEVAQGNEDFSTLVAAITAAGRVIRAQK